MARPLPGGRTVGGDDAAVHVFCEADADAFALAIEQPADLSRGHRREVVDLASTYRAVARRPRAGHRIPRFGARTRNVDHRQAAAHRAIPRSASRRTMTEPG